MGPSIPICLKESQMLSPTVRSLAQALFQAALLTEKNL